jgi:hypothetical protein
MSKKRSTEIRYVRDEPSDSTRHLDLSKMRRVEQHMVLKRKLRRAAGQARRGELADGEQFFERLFSRLGRKSKKTAG